MIHSAAWAQKYWKRWYFWAAHSKLPEIIKVAKLIHSHLANVLRCFKHRITHAVAEGLNSKIATIHKRAFGFRNFEHFQIAVYIHCGGLEQYGGWAIQSICRLGSAPSKVSSTEIRRHCIRRWQNLFSIYAEMVPCWTAITRRFWVT